MAKEVKKSLKSINITETNVIIYYTETVFEQDGDQPMKVTEFKKMLDSPVRPHQLLLDCMKKLKRHGLEMLELKHDNKTISSWGVPSLRISGDMSKETSKVVMVLTHELKTKRMHKHRTFPVKMYGESEYPACVEMTVIIEDICEEVWKYITDGQQLTIFEGLKVAS